MAVRRKHLDRFNEAIRAIATYAHVSSTLDEVDPLPGQVDRRTLRIGLRTANNELIHVGPFITSEQWHSIAEADVKHGELSLAKRVAAAFLGDDSGGI